MPSLPVLTPTQASDWDRAAETAGIERATLMETAGRAAASVIAARFPELLGQGVLVAAGTGDNGGDGWVVARALHRLEVPVWVAPLAGEASALQQRMAQLARAEGVRVVAPDGPWPSVALLVDAILGTGAHGAPRPPAAALVQRLLDASLPVVALDGPTGVDLLTGASHGVPIHAALTITFGGLRRGHLLAREDVGDVIVVDIGHPPAPSAWPPLLTDALAAEWLPRLRAADHKGDRGRLVVIGGDSGMSGALRLAARAGFAAGAGLVHAAGPPDTIAALTAAEPDLQTLVQSFDQPPSKALLELVARADAVVIGPGLGRAPGRRGWIVKVMGAARAVVLDADGLMALQGAAAELKQASSGKRVVLTPHPGEFRALFPARTRDMEIDPWAAAGGGADDAGCVVLLKGVPTVVAAPGRAGHTVAAGNPGLATGGSGDLLSGFVGTGLAQGLEPEIAAALGAQILGRAADLAARRTTARGMRPMDVLAALPDLWRAWEVLRQSRPAPRPPILFELETPQRI